MNTQGQTERPEFKVLQNAKGQPFFSVMIALYNAEPYFEATIESLMKQTVSRGLLEFVVVDDGSTDRSLAIAQEWARRDARVTLITKSNEGIAPTRRLALAHARGKWVTTVDPDDVIGRSYFHEVKSMMDIDTSDEVALYVTRVFLTQDPCGRFKDNHPLGGKFRRGNRIVSLNAEPNAIQLGATCFMRRDVLGDAGLTYDPKVRPTFEDGHLIGRYLLKFINPMLGIVATAHYFYRKRSDNSSAVQSTWGQVEKYTVQPRYGYLDLLKRASDEQGEVPDWLACTVLYDLMWIFKQYHVMGSKVRWLPVDAQEEFLRICDEIFSHVSWRQLCLLEVNAPRFSLREAIGLGFSLIPGGARLFRWGPGRSGGVGWTLEVDRIDRHVEIFVNGARVEVIPDGVMDHHYFGRLFMREYSFTLPQGSVGVYVDGKPIPVSQAKVRSPKAPTEPRASELTDAARHVAGAQSKMEKRLERLRVEALVGGTPMLTTLTRKAASRIRRAQQASRPDVQGPGLETKPEIGDSFWLLIDRPDKADDNAEHLYRYILRNRPDIPAFFLLDPNSRDWPRLEDEGFRLLPYGSEAATAAAKSAKVVISSDATKECMDLVPGQAPRDRTWKFVFLQHGVSINDISDWLNEKTIDLCIAATPKEYDAFVWRESRYRFKRHQVALTGFPRHDALLRLARARTAADDVGALVLLIMPTWRRGLKLALDAAASDGERRVILRESSFLQGWLGVLGSARVRSLVEDGLLHVRFVAHPNLVEYQTLLDLPPWVEMVDATSLAFQPTIVSADLFLTDYSSLIFETAYIGRACAYFQFDQDRMNGAEHSWNPGYFDYARDGFGPLLSSAQDVEDWISEMVGRRGQMDPEYARRIAATFAFHDDRNCERVLRSIEHMLGDDTDEIVQEAEVFSKPSALGSLAGFQAGH